MKALLAIFILAAAGCGTIEHEAQRKIEQITEAKVEDIVERAAGKLLFKHAPPIIAILSTILAAKYGIHLTLVKRKNGKGSTHAKPPLDTLPVDSAMRRS